MQFTTQRKYCFEVSHRDYIITDLKLKNNDKLLHAEKIEKKRIKT